MLLRQELAPTIIETEPVATCRHYWVIAPAEGPVSRGVCQYCHEIKEFHNSITEVEKIPQ